MTGDSLTGGVSIYQKYLRSVEAQPLWKASLFMILSLVLFLFMIMSALRQTFITIANLWNQINTDKVLIDQADNKIRLIQQGNQQVQNIQNKLPLLETAIPKTPAFASWANYLQDLTENTSVKLASVSVNTTSPITQNQALFKPATEISFTLIVSGKTQNAVDFLDRLSKLPRLTLIEEAKLSTLKENQVEMSVKGRLVYLPYNYAQE